MAAAQSDGGACNQFLGKPSRERARPSKSQLMSPLHDDDVIGLDVTHRRGDRLGEFLEIPTSDASAASRSRDEPSSVAVTGVRYLPDS